MTPQQSFEAVVAKLLLKPHPEGGFYRETYRSEVDSEFREHGRRAAGTSIYFLMPRGEISRFHRFEFSDFELASKDQLLEIFSHARPETREWISRLTQD